MPTPPMVSGAVLAGGSSRRMGRDKRSMPIDGVPMLRRVVDAVGPLVDDLRVVVASAEDGESVADLIGDASVEVDRRPDAGPLAGIETALRTARHDRVLVVAADHPRLAPAVLRLLLDQLPAGPSPHLAAALVTDRGPQPLVAVYRRAAGELVADLLDQGERRATALVEQLPTHRVEPGVWRELDPDGWTVRDLDTPGDLAAFDPVHRDRVASLPVTAIRDGRPSSRQDPVVDEEPLEIRACGPGQAPVTLVTTMRTRGHDDDLAAGWVWSEGLLAPGAIEAISVGDAVRLARPDDQVTLHLRHAVDPGAIAHRHTTATASCGVCGRASIDELAARAEVIPPDVAAHPPLPWSLVTSLPDRMRDAQVLFASTGAIHATGLFGRDGDLATLREDVGRHNALDAAIGVHVRRDALPLPHHLGVLSGRVGFELVAKAAMAGLPVLVAVGAPTTLAVRTAERFGVTLVGFVRRGDGNVYTHPHRLAL